MMDFYSIYLHIPFCSHRCSYCDFNTYAGLESSVPDYVSALCSEIRLASQLASSKLPVHTVFFGGGTPSLLSPAEIEKVISTLDQSFDLLIGIEITLEANPGTVSLPYLLELSALGINRLSLGMQSAHLAELRLLERIHDQKDVVNAMDWARQAGFTNINLDLIFGIPHQSLANWQATLSLALSLQPEHLSLYALTIEQGTPIEKWVSRGLLSSPDDDLAADMYLHASQILAQSGYQPYEISNWARSNQAGDAMFCRHNLQYWRLLPYLGFGAGAHGFSHPIRTANVLSPQDYIQRMKLGSEEFAGTFPCTPATCEMTRLDRQAEMGEFMMMGLRLVEEGISAVEFQRRFGTSLKIEYGPVIDQLVKKKLLVWDEAHRRLRLAPQARLLGNQVFCEFV